MKELIIEDALTGDRTKVEAVPGTIIRKEIDPHGKEQHEEGAKLDAGKPDCSLLLMFGKALEAVGRVGTFGASKYSRGGWQSVPGGQERYTAALLRHMLKEHYEDNDPDSGLLHAAHAAWNALARLELTLRKSDDEGRTTSAKEVR